MLSDLVSRRNIQPLYHALSKVWGLLLQLPVPHLDRGHITPPLLSKPDPLETYIQSHDHQHVTLGTTMVEEPPYKFIEQQ